MFQELVARVVDLGQGRVRLELARVAELAREVLARVEELEEAAYRIDVFVRELDLAGLYFGREEVSLFQWSFLSCAITFRMRAEAETVHLVIASWTYASIIGKLGACSRKERALDQK